MPGDNITMEIELITPIAIEEGLRFAIREGGARRCRRSSLDLRVVGIASIRNLLVAMK